MQNIRRGLTPPDHDGENNDGATEALPTETLKNVRQGLLSTVATDIAAAQVATPQDLKVLTIATETVFSTTTIHVKPSHTPTLTATPCPISQTSDTEALSSTSDGLTVDTTDDVVTGDMFCPATNRPNDVYTPCPYIHTHQPSMVDATALPSVVASSAGRRGVRNPCPAMLKELPRFIEAAKELVRRSKRLIEFLVRDGQTIASDILHPHTSNRGLSDEPCLAGRGRASQLQDQIRDLQQKNERLREGIYNARDVMSMQQDLLDAHMGIIQKQRAQIEEATRFKLWWASTQNRTRRHQSD